MALTGLEIFKLLPKTNCGECGVPTCLAFAMKLAQKKAELAECPHASENAKEVLGAASEPPMRTLRIGVGADAFEIGGETELFRHNKTFCHQTAIFIRLDDTNDSAVLAAQVREADGYVLDRVGERLHIDGFYLANVSADSGRYLDALKTVVGETAKAVIVSVSDPTVATAAATFLDGKRMILHPDGEASRFVPVAQEIGSSLIVNADSLENLAKQAETVAESGYKDIFLHVSHTEPHQTLQHNTVLRRAALRKSVKSVGFPLVAFLREKDTARMLADAVVALCKYTGILVLPKFEREAVLSLLTLRQNIYSDPQKPIQVDPRLHAIGEPQPDSPVFVTTNFSLTYFIVSGEIENAGLSAWLVIPDCEGMSVLTAWAAGKFSGAKIAKFTRDIHLEEKVRRREIIIPGYVASISGELEEALPGWRVMVGPQEASDLGSFIKNCLTP